MDPALQQQLAEYLKAMLDTAKSGASFVADQAPLVVQEKIAYGRIMEPLMLACGLGLVWFGFFLCRKGKPYMAEGHGAFIPLFMGGGISVILGGIVIAVQANATVLVWAAPRLYVLEWAMSLVKK